MLITSHLQQCSKWLKKLEQNIIDNLLQQHLMAERLENWRFILSALYKMLPYFAECGHNKYIKSVVLDLQQMNNLEHNSPQVYQDFMAGFHVVCRTYVHSWRDVPPDHIIETTLMRSVSKINRRFHMRKRIWRSPT